MALFIPPQTTLAEAWVETLRAVHGAGGAATNVLTTVSNPALEQHAAFRAAYDRHIYRHRRKKNEIYTAETVASTIFPEALYRRPEGRWALGDSNRFEAAEDALYARYLKNYPTLKRTARANQRGTYFGRLVCWDSGKGEPINQLKVRIAALREAQHRPSPIRTWNAFDFSLGDEGLVTAEESPPGMQMYQPGDHGTLSQRGFPCMVHVDLSLVRGRINLTGIYRHQYVITKGYGNLLGLARLQSFVAQQSGFEVGELSVLGTYSDDERKGAWNQSLAAQILSDTSAALA
ncbi:hypothetical protein [Microbacterium sp. WCS2018Hpa-9]|uniref:hypothetical protein n=1 Tax=Microbacterium sp. WCS2018Hpa-9 TaxID=3073635 RepID=UPI002889C75B|nr:hypothetical protein [Microbacterium sp. WCS2018Hpa-9]